MRGLDWQEREEGYFDSEGNYVEYRIDKDVRVGVDTGTKMRSVLCSK